MGEPDAAAVHGVLTGANDAPRAELGRDPAKMEAAVRTMQRFLDTYRPPGRDVNEDVPWTSLPVRQLYKKAMRTAIDVIDDVASTVSQRDRISSAELRRRIVRAVTLPERRVSVGLWLIFASFVLCFLDASA